MVLVAAEFCVNAVVLFELSEVNAPDAAVPVPTAPFMLVAKIAPPTPKPPVTINAPDVVLVEAPELVASIVGDDTDVNEPVLGLELPMLMLVIVPATVELRLNVAPELILASPVGLIVTVPVPVGDITTVWFAPVRSILPLIVNVPPASPIRTSPVDDPNVKLPTGLIVACAPGCIDTELCGLISTSPVPVGLISTLLSAGFSSTFPSAFSKLLKLTGNSKVVVPANALVRT